MPYRPSYNPYSFRPAETASQSTKFRSQWREFESTWLAEYRERMEEQRQAIRRELQDNLLQNPEAQATAGPSSSQREQQDTWPSRYLQDKEMEMRKLQQDFAVRARQEWAERLQSAGLRPEDWGYATPIERAVMERALGVTSTRGLSGNEDRSQPNGRGRPMSNHSMPQSDMRMEQQMQNRKSNQEDAKSLASEEHHETKDTADGMASSRVDGNIGHNLRRRHAATQRRRQRYERHGDRTDTALIRSDRSRYMTAVNEDDDDDRKEPYITYRSPTPPLPMMVPLRSDDQQGGSRLSYRSKRSNSKMTQAGRIEGFGYHHEDDTQSDPEGDKVVTGESGRRWGGERRKLKKGEVAVRRRQRELEGGGLQQSMYCIPFGIHIPMTEPLRRLVTRRRRDRPPSLT